MLRSIRGDGRGHYCRGIFDKELDREGFTYVLESGAGGTVHIEQVLEYNQDPIYLRDMILYKLTIEAQKRVNISPLSKREIIRRLSGHQRPSSTVFLIRRTTINPPTDCCLCFMFLTATLTSSYPLKVREWKSLWHFYIRTSSSVMPRPDCRLLRACSIRCRKRGSCSSRYANQSSSVAKPMSMPAGFPCRIL
jgi:hypothetical protein